MKIIRLEAGTSAPIDSDAIEIERRDDGRFDLTGAILAGAESTAIVADEPYETRGLAEAAGAAWAERHGVRRLYVVITESLVDQPAA